VGRLVGSDILFDRPMLSNGSNWLCKACGGSKLK
jgi:hypothetical protein